MLSFRSQAFHSLAALPIMMRKRRMIYWPSLMYPTSLPIRRKFKRLNNGARRTVACCRLNQRSWSLFRNWTVRRVPSYSVGVLIIPALPAKAAIVAAFSPPEKMTATCKAASSARRCWPRVSIGSYLYVKRRLRIEKLRSLFSTSHLTREIPERPPIYRCLNRSIKH